MAKNTLNDLYILQALPLDVKIEKTKKRIKEWYDYWDGQVHVSFSGGKDSTVLLDLVRNVCGYTDVPAVFVDTGLEYPEIRKFVKGVDNVEWLKPKKNFKQVINEYGYPFISKRVSDYAQGAKKCKKELELGKRKNTTERYRCLMGTAVKKDGQPSRYNMSRYKFLLDAPFEVSSKCCDIMKKAPVHTYGQTTGRKPITAQMAIESDLRTIQWITNGCNGFQMTSPISNPMSFWTEQDVLLYIKLHNLPICSVYGDIVEDIGGTDEVEGQMTFSDLEGFEGMELFDAKRPPLKTTGCSRTGCMFCGYGCHLEKGEGRFEMMKRTHPKQYDYIMRPTEEGGLNYKEVIDWLNEHGNLNIKY